MAYSEAEIKSELKDQGVTNVKRIKAKRNGQLVETNSYIVTLRFPRLGKVSVLFNDTANLERLYCVILIVQN